MLECELIINTCRGLLGLVGALLVVIGVITVDSLYDNEGRTDSSIGTLLFFGGWVLFACSVGLLNNDLSGFNIDIKALLGIIGSVLVMLAASISQKVMYKKDMMQMMIFLIFFMIAWGILVYAISYPSTILDKHRLVKFYIAILGAAGVVLGMVFQMYNRKRGLDFVKTGVPSTANAYSPGLPFFTAGWLFLAFANAIL